METFTVELEDAQVEQLERRGRRRGVESVEAYVQTIVEQFVAHLDDERNIEEAVEEKLESLGYL